MAERPGAKTFDPSQIQQILRRAADTSTRAADTLTLDELTEVARDAGITRADLERAIAELDAPAPRARSARGPLDILFGGPLELTLERPLEGELEPAQLETLRAELESALGPGRAWSAARSWSWSSALWPAVTRVAVNGRSLRVDARFFGLAGALFGGLAIGGANAVGWPIFGILLFFYGPLLAIGAGLTAAVVPVMLARWIYSRAVEARRQKLEALLERLPSGRGPSTLG